MRAARRRIGTAIVSVSVLIGLGGPAGAGVAGAATGTLATIAITEDTVIAGSPAQAVLTLVATATSDTPVALSSTDTSVVTVPPSVTVPAGQLGTTFTVTTIPFTGPGNFACVNASAGGGSSVDCLNVNPLPSGPTLQSLTFTPSTVAGGSPTTGNLRFASVTDGALVTLVSANPAVVSVPAETFVSGGQSTGAFPVTTSAVTATTSVAVTATAFGVSRTATLTVTPSTTPPVADLVRITRAEWRRGILRIEATSTNHNAILGVHLTVSNSFMFELDNRGGGRYGLTRSWLDNPRRITVRSNFGGEATADIR